MDELAQDGGELIATWDTLEAIVEAKEVSMEDVWAAIQTGQALAGRFWRMSDLEGDRFGEWRPALVAVGVRRKKRTFGAVLADGAAEVRRVPPPPGVSLACGPVCLARRCSTSDRACLRQEPPVEAQDPNELLPVTELKGLFASSRGYFSTFINGERELVTRASYSTSEGVTWVKRTYNASRIIATTHLRFPTASEVVVHRGGDRNNFSAERLTWGSPADAQRERAPRFAYTRCTLEGTVLGRYDTLAAAASSVGAAASILGLAFITAKADRLEWRGYRWEKADLGKAEAGPVP